MENVNFFRGCFCAPNINREMTSVVEQTWSDFVTQTLNKTTKQSRLWDEKIDYLLTMIFVLSEIPFILVLIVWYVGRLACGNNKRFLLGLTPFSICSTIIVYRLSNDRSEQNKSYFSLLSSAIRRLIQLFQQNSK